MTKVSAFEFHQNDFKFDEHGVTFQYAGRTRRVQYASVTALEKQIWPAVPDKVWFVLVILAEPARYRLWFCEESERDAVYQSFQEATAIRI